MGNAESGKLLQLIGDCGSRLIAAQLPYAPDRHAGNDGKNTQRKIVVKHLNRFPVSFSVHSMLSSYVLSRLVIVLTGTHKNDASLSFDSDFFLLNNSAEFYSVLRWVMSGQHEDHDGFLLDDCHMLIASEYLHSLLYRCIFDVYLIVDVCSECFVWGDGKVVWLVSRMLNVCTPEINRDVLAFCFLQLLYSVILLLGHFLSLRIHGTLFGDLLGTFLSLRIHGTLFGDLLGTFLSAWSCIYTKQ